MYAVHGVDDKKFLALVHLEGYMGEGGGSGPHLFKRDVNIIHLVLDIVGSVL